MLKVFLVIVACAEPNFTECLTPKAIGPFANPELCQLERSVVTPAYQLAAPEGWRIFTKCQLINPTKNGRLG